MDELQDAIMDLVLLYGKSNAMKSKTLLEIAETWRSWIDKKYTEQDIINAMKYHASNGGQYFPKVFDVVKALKTLCPAKAVESKDKPKIDTRSREEIKSDDKAIEIIKQLSKSEVRDISKITTEMHMEINDLDLNKGGVDFLNQMPTCALRNILMNGQGVEFRRRAEEVIGRKIIIDKKDG